MQASFLTDIFLPILTILAMVGLGISLTVADFKQLLVRPKALFVGLANQLLLVPVMGILLALVLPLSPELAAGLIVTAAAPGGVGSNASNYLLDGDSALSISLTTVSNIVAFITLPLWTALGLFLFTGATKIASVSLAQIIMPVAVTTLIPISAGLFIRQRWPQLGQRLRRPLRKGLALLLIVAIVGFLMNERGNLLYYMAQAGTAGVMLYLTTVTLGFVTAWLFKFNLRTRITIANESGIQNVPLALLVTATILANPLMAITPASYTLVQICIYTVIMVIAFSPWFSRLSSEQTGKDVPAPY